jgi:hypothetical protein
MLPAIAATTSVNASMFTSIAPLAATAPATNRSESPGRNGVTTNPVSAKMIAKRIA